MSDTNNWPASSTKSSSGSSTKKTDFSIESLLRTPYYCHESKYLNDWKEIKHIEPPSQYHNFQLCFNFPQPFTNVQKYRVDVNKTEEEDSVTTKQNTDDVNSVKEQERESGHEDKEFSWLYCSRFKPPKLPRSKKRGGCKRYGRGPRIPFAPYQITVLENAFKKSQYLSPDGISRLAESLFLTETRVKIWLQNRRARERKQNK